MNKKKIVPNHFFFSAKAKLKTKETHSSVFGVEISLERHEYIFCFFFCNSHDMIQTYSVCIGSTPLVVGFICECNAIQIRIFDSTLMGGISNNLILNDTTFFFRYINRFVDLLGCWIIVIRFVDIERYEINCFGIKTIFAKSVRCDQAEYFKRNRFSSPFTFAFREFGDHVYAKSTGANCTFG